MLIKVNPNLKKSKKVKKKAKKKKERKLAFPRKLLSTFSSAAHFPVQRRKSDTSIHGCRNDSLSSQRQGWIPSQPNNFG